MNAPKPDIIRQEERLAALRNLSQSLEDMFGSVRMPDNPSSESDPSPTKNFLLARGLLQKSPESETYSDILTALSVKVSVERDADSAHFSTNVGQLPNSATSSAVIQALNLRLEGKIVTFPTEEERVDLVYTTNQPIEWLNSERLNRELENHAKAQTLVSGLLGSLNVQDPSPASRSGESAILPSANVSQEGTSFSGTLRRAQNFVDHHIHVDFPNMQDVQYQNRLKSRENLHERGL